MREQIKWGLYLIGLGCGLTAYAHLNFATKTRVQRIEDKLEAVSTRDDVKEVKLEVSNLRKEILEIYKRSR